ncbi:MAG: GNAT family N-acetyltransferase [Hyphomicrobiales bacterium]
MAAGDLDRVHALNVELGYPGDKDVTRERIEAVLASPIADAFVAEDEAGRVVGWAHVFAAPFIESGPVAELGGLVVEESRRGQGIGAALVARAEAWARERGLTQLSLRCNVVREETHRFYHRLGFTIQKTQHKFRKAVP